MKQKLLDHGNPDLYSSPEYPHCSFPGPEGGTPWWEWVWPRGLRLWRNNEGICDLFAQGARIPREEVKRWGPGLGFDAF